MRCDIVSYMSAEQQIAENIIKAEFPHINDRCKLNQDKCFGAMEKDIRDVLKKHTYPIGLWLIDAIVCHYTGRGSELNWE